MPNLTARQMLSRIPVRMAEGGEARGFSDDEVKQFIQSTYAQFGGPGVEAHKAIADAMAQYGVGVNQVARATGYTPREVEAEFMGQRAGERPVLDDPTGTAAGMSAAYRAAAQAGGQQTVDDYYANLRADAAAYLANPNAPTGVDAYNQLIQSGISTSDLRAAGVADEVLNKIFTVSGPIEQSKFVTPAGMTSAYERSPDLAFESQRLGQEGRAILDAQGRDYIANLQQGGIDAAERAQMLEYATERGYSFDDLLKAGVDPNVLFRDDGSAAAAAAAAEAERQRLADIAAAEAERQRLAGLAAAEAERQRLAAIAAAEAAELERQRLAKLPTDEAVVAPGVTVGDMVKAVTPTYNAQQLQNIIKAAENQPAAAGTVANPIDTRGSAATGSQSGVSKFLETYNPAAPFVAPAYTAPTVYQPLPAQPDMFAAGQPALDPAFRESAPRTAIPGQPGQFDYSPAAKLRPATGSGFTFTPPSVTTRPRSLLSPLAIQGYGGTMSASQRFAQNRSLVDRNLRDMLGATPALRNASTYNLLRNRVMAGEFGADPARVFDPTTTEGQKFQAFLASLAGTAPAQAAATGTTTGTVADAVIDIDATDRQIAAGGGTTSGTTVAGGYAAPIDASPLAYGGYRLEPFSKGGAVKKSDGSARDGLAHFANGGEASAAELLRRQLEGIDNTPTARTSEREPTPEQTESRTMLERLGRFASLDTPQDMGLGETTADIGMGFLPVVGTAQGARDFERARRDEDKLGMLLSAASMFPVAGGAVRAIRSAGKASRAADDLAALTAQVPTDIPQPSAALDMPPLENAQRTQLGSSTIPSYAKARDILSSKNRILDFGAGRGQGASLIGADTFEPYPREGFNPSFSNVADIPSGSYDGLTSLNVLNVMPREVRDDAVRNIGRILADDGEAVITTRGRDVMTAKGVDGPEPMSRITTADTYQKGFTQQELTDYVSNVLGENFVVGSLPQKIGAAGVLVKKTKATNNTGSAAGEARQMLDAVTQAAMPRTPAVGMPVNFSGLRQAGVSPQELRQIDESFRTHQGAMQSVDELVSTAARVDPLFQESVLDVANSIGGTYVQGPLKTPESISEKLVRKGGSAAEVPDSVRATILVQNNEQAEEAIRQIAGRYPMIDEGWQRVPSNGYIDRKLAIQFTGPNGERLLGEIQINTPPMQTVKDTIGHTLYEEERRLIQQSGGVTQMSPEELMRYRSVVEQQSQVYGEAASRIDPSIIKQVTDKRARGGYIGRLGRL